MSYSRWSNGDWYVFWTSSSGETLADQCLAMWHIAGETPEITYPELKEAYEANDLQRFFPDWIPEYAIVELATYVDEWLQDMELEFTDKPGF